MKAGIGTAVAFSNHSVQVPLRPTSDQRLLMPALVATTAPFSSGPARGSAWESEVVELPILLPEWQVSALERAAQERGMTIGQLLRRLFADLFPPAPHDE